MGARQSKRVEISSTPKKGDIENGAIVGTEEKLEKIEEGETVASKTNANGSTTTSSTVTAEQQETVTTNAEIAAVSETTPSKEVVINSESVTEVVGSAEKSIDEETISPSNVEDNDKEQETKSTTASPTEGTTTTEDGASATSEKKKKPKKKWSFRSFSFSRKDRQKPVPSKEEPKQQDALPEANEAVSQAEQQNDEDVEKLKKQGVEKKKDDQVPPPLPTSPPPTPAEEIAVVATSVAPVSVAPIPVKEESPIISEADVDASGGGEALAEPLEEGELERSIPLTTISTTVTTTTTTTTSDLTNAMPALTNGMNGVSKLNGEVTENGELSSPVCELKTPIDVESVTAKIDSLKLQITTDNVESSAQNGFGDHSLNGESNGVDGEVRADVSSDCHFVSDSVVSVDYADVSADVSAD